MSTTGIHPGGNIVETILSHASINPDRPAIIDDDRIITYSDLQRLISQHAGYLSARGIGRHDRLGLVLQDHADHLILILAAASLGAASLSLNWRSKLDEKRALAERFGVKLILSEVGARVPENIPSVPLDDAWRDGVAKAVPCGPVSSAASLPLRVLLTSGTTGLPKGIELTHAGVAAWCESLRLALHLTTPQRYLSTSPLAYTASLNLILPHLILGDTIRLFPTLFTPEEFVNVVRTGGITCVFTVPTILRRLLPLASESGPLLPQLQYLLIGGAAITAEEALAGKRLITSDFVPSYGASGCGPIAYLTPEFVEAKPGSVGRAVPLREVEIVDRHDSPLPSGAVGVLRCRGPGVATGFCNTAAESETETFRDGWYYPGELAHIDVDGFIFIDGRVSDMIIHGGNNVYPAEVEQILLRQPGVGDVAVVGTPSQEYGEDVLAIVKASGKPSERDLLEACRRSLTPYKVPKAVVFVDEFPKNAAGKVLKLELLQMVAQGRRLPSGI